MTLPEQAVQQRFAQRDERRAALRLPELLPAILGTTTLDPLPAPTQTYRATGSSQTRVSVRLGKARGTCTGSRSMKAGLASRS